MTIETYTLQFHMAKTTDSQDVQNRYLLYNQVQDSRAAEDEQNKAIRARQKVQDANETEGKIVDPDGEGRNAGAFRRKKRQGGDAEDQSRKRGGSSGGGQLIDVII